MKKTGKWILLFPIAASIIILGACSTEENEETTTKEEMTTQDYISVEVDFEKTDFISGFSLGTTLTHYFWERGDSEAVGNVEELFNSFSKVNNQHIMGWGADNPWPDKEGDITFTSLDYRMTYLKYRLDGEMMITFCQAPGWMKGTGDWEMEAAVLEEHFDDFAYLCARIAERYPDVKYFQVWNEFKGFWIRGKGWDYEGYTNLYNKVYREVKKVRPDAKVGGFYLPFSGDGSRELFGIEGTNDHSPILESQRKGLEYWLENKEGADFVCIRKSLRDWHNREFEPTAKQSIEMTQMFERVVEQVRELTELPMVMSEFYGYTMEKEGKPDETVDAAQYAAMYYHMIRGARERPLKALIWIQIQENVPGSLFTDTDQGGGEPRLHAEVAKEITKHFSSGESILEIEVSDPKVKALASETRIMLINTTDENLAVSVNNGEIFNIGPFEVYFTDS